MADVQGVNRERVVTAVPGAPMLLLFVALLVGVPLYLGAYRPEDWRVAVAVLVLVADLVAAVGFFSVQPNEARVMVLLGSYKGTVRKSGFYWANPFYSNGRGQMTMVQNEGQAKIVRTGPGGGRSAPRNKVSLRARTLNGEKLKVNDKRGNPIEIAAVIVWHVVDTAQAFFDVDDFEAYVPIQSESALRHIANMYSYDDGEGGETTLRSNVDEVSQALRAELLERCARAGVVIDEARLTHLAYAPEIAQVMLRRQQADAVIAARARIVEGAVSMVDMALRELADKAVVNFDDERRAAMVSNLMVVLCSESEVHPIVNTGTLYS